MARGGRGEGGEEEVAAVVELEDAVKLLVEHLVMPVLPRGAFRREDALAPEKQETVARQVHATVLLYNYYHRSQFPRLEFADPRRFCVSASLAAGDPLLLYLNDQVHGGGGGLSATDKAVVDACGIAEALDATQDAPEMTVWPISKVAVLLLDRTKKRCLIEHGPVTKGVWSIVEKETGTASGNSRSSDQSVGSSNNAVTDDSGPYALQQLAYTEVERRTGMKRSNLRLLEEHLAYSLSKKETTTKLFILQYEKTVNSKLKEMPLKDLIGRMSGPIFKNDPDPITTSVVEYYHILPYKSILSDLLNREWPADSSLSAPKEQSCQNGKSSLQSVIDENLKEQEANSQTKTKETSDVTIPKKQKQAVKAVDNKNKKNSNMNSKRKSEALKDAPANCTDCPGGESPTEENGPLAVPDVEVLKTVSNSVNAKATTAPSGTIVDVKGVQKGKKTEKHRTTTQDVSTVQAPVVDPLMICAFENKNEKEAEKSGGFTGNMNGQTMYASLQSLKKMRDDTLREHCVLGDRGAQYDMDIQTILTEGEMTPTVMSILKRYEDNSSNMMEVASSNSSGEGCPTMNIKRKRLTEAVLLRNKCQELDEICRDNNWILPRYKVLPSHTDGMYQATVYLIGPDFDMSADGDLKTTPREARDSAASNLLFQLYKAKEKLEVRERSASDPVSTT